MWNSASVPSVPYPLKPHGTFFPLTSRVRLLSAFICSPTYCTWVMAAGRQVILKTIYKIFNMIRNKNISWIHYIVIFILIMFSDAVFLLTFKKKTKHSFRFAAGYRQTRPITVHFSSGVNNRIRDKIKHYPCQYICRLVHCRRYLIA